MQNPTGENIDSYSGLVGLFIDFINILIPAIFAIIFVYLVWKILDSWVLHAGDPAKVAEGRVFAVTAVLVLVVMLSFWGIIALVRTSFLGLS
jgi:hypothetical protein